MSGPNRFRFRAWDIKHEEMRFDVDVRSRPDGHIQANAYHGDGGHTCEAGEDLYRNSKWLVLMQSTGLTDKSGKEIFEGDVVEYESYQLDRDHDRAVVTFGVGTFDSGVYKYHGFHLRDSGGEPLDNSATLIEPDALEVIGNIYENPEFKQ